MDYEKEYKEALERAKKWYNAPNVDKIPTYANRVIEEIFPELCESEDEKVRKALLELVRQSSEVLDKQNQNNMIAWLEKQGEHKKFRDSIQVGDEVTRNSDGVIVNLSQLKRVAKPAQQKLPIEKLPEEMKTVGESLGFTTQEECDEYNQMVSDIIMSADKVEPKFKVGDWIIDDKNRVGIIVRILDEHYIISFDGREVQISFEWEGKLFRKWSIKDAKDGDVLAGIKGDVILIFRGIGNTRWDDVIDYYCYYECYQKDFVVQEDVEHWGDIKNNQLKPATKEQRDLLFQKMKEAGYEWDKNNKMLKEIVEDEEEPQNYKNQIMSEITDLVKHYIKQKPSCSEASEDIKEALRTEYEKGRADAFAQMQKEWSEEDEEMFEYTISLLNYNLGCRKWLQSLKERHIWKPSDAQIRALEYIINNAHNTSYSCKIAKELLEQLKKLKGE